MALPHGNDKQAEPEVARRGGDHEEIFCLEKGSNNLLLIF
jgi:hypothetical protein